MKKLIINFITIILLIFTSINFTFAEKIVCTVVKNHEIIRVFLYLCNDSNTKLRHIWFKDLDPDLVNDNQFEILDLINGIEISDQDKWYNPLMEYINQFNNLVHSQLQPTDLEQQKTQLNVEIFTILGWKLHEAGYDL